MLRGVQWQYLGLAFLLIASGCTRRPSADDYRAAQDLYQRRQMRPCLEKSRAALKSLSRERNPSLHFRFRFLEAASLIGLKDPKAAMAILSEPIPPAMANTAEAVLWRMNLGMAHLYNANFELAVKWLGEAHRAALQSGSALLVAEVEARQGAMAIRMKENARAETLLRRALDVATREGNASLRTIAMGNLGVLLTQSYRLQEAVYWQEQIAREFRKLGDTDSVARVTGNLGWALMLLGDLDGALARYQEAEAEFGKAGNRLEQLTWLGNIGNIHLLRDDYAAAETSYDAALKLARQINAKLEESWWLSKLTSLALARKDWTRAGQLHADSTRLAGEIGSSERDLTLMNNAAALAAGQGKHPEAESIFRTVAASQSDDPTPVLNAHAALAALYAGLGQTARARQAYRQTLDLVEVQRERPLEDKFKLPYAAHLIRFHRQYVDFLVANGDIDGALHAADSTHARILQDPRKASAVDPRQLARRTQSVLLVYWLAPERSYLWEITPGDIKLHTLPAGARIRSLVAQHNGFITNLGNPVQGGGLAGERLWQTVIAPASESIARTRRVIVVPDSSLYALNFESLPVADPDPHYWLEDATISIVPALRFLRPSPELPALDKSVLLVGNPEPAGPEFPKLEHAAAELEEIGKRFPRSQVLDGTAASPEGYARSNPARFSLIHFAAHASSNTANPLQSAIVLSRGAENHLLSASDVMRVPLRARLVTISACSSAGSRIYSGEGLVGLTWAFLRAGARGVIAGLWDVPDRDTSKLMGHLYSRLAEGDQPEEALRQAKMMMLRSGTTSALPYNWAAFQHYAGGY